MSVVEIRDSEQARHFLLQSLICGRVQGAADHFVQQMIGIAYELASESRPVLPLGMLADLGQLALGNDSANADVKPFTTLPAEVATQYEDQLLGKVYSDSSFERAGTAVVRYEDRDQLQALAYLIHRIQARGKLPAIQINPSVIRPFQRMSPDAIIEEVQASLQDVGLLPEVVELYNGSVEAIRHLGDALGNEDIFELESGTALGGFGQRVALRQIMRATGEFSDMLKRRPVIHESNRRRLIATNLSDEDAYPVGGFTSISTRGSIESLLHSQLVFMEQDEAERPDLFDIKFLRDELLYYARDDNQFLRQRRTYLFVLNPDLESARVKNENDRYQRLIYGLALIVTLCEKISEWLSEEALRFEFVFIKEKQDSLTSEEELFELIFREQITHNLAQIHRFTKKEFSEFCNESNYGALCHVISMTSQDKPPQHEIGNSLLTELKLQEHPHLDINHPRVLPLETPHTWEEVVPTLADFLML